MLTKPPLVEDSRTSCVCFLLSLRNLDDIIYFICLSSCSSFLRPCTIRHHQHNEKHSMVESGRWHSSHREQHGGEDRRLCQRECLGQRFVPGFGDLNDVPAGLLEHHLLGQLAAGRQSTVALRCNLQKEVKIFLWQLKVRHFKLFIFFVGLISNGRRTFIWTTCLEQSSPCYCSSQFTFTSSKPWDVLATVHSWRLTSGLGHGSYTRINLFPLLGLILVFCC